jgi:hypothetical protein
MVLLLPDLRQILQGCKKNGGLRQKRNEHSTSAIKITDKSIFRTD